MKTIPKPYDFDNFRLGRVGEYFPSFLSKTYGGNVEKTKTAWAFSFQAKTHEALDMGVSWVGRP